MKLARRLATAGLGVLVGLGLIEGAARLRDHGAFPHLNVYRPDAALGVRLVPNATERISFSGNAVSAVRVNAQGYRGADWPARADAELFVVGDSQAFGLGVGEADAFAWRLGAKLGRPVANGAVPTYGPSEYNAVLAEELPRRKPRTVIWVVNLANDLFEASHANPTRHAVWDGWAVRKETAPASVTSFPGRTWLFRDSHAFFAARGLWFRANAGTEHASEGAVPSEGTWRDLLDTSKTRSAEVAEARRAEEAERAAREQRFARTQGEIRKLDAELGDKMQKALDDFEVGPSTLRAAKASPGDIVRVFYGEGSAPVPVIAEQIREAAEARKRFEEKLRAARDAATIAQLQRRDALDEERAKLLLDARGAARARTPLRAHLERAKVLCDEHGAELVVLVLPLDVMVSQDEWKKYGAAPVNLSATRVLADDVLTIAEELGARVVDAWPVLAAAEPGAFLHGDLHMTPKGHAAVADALAGVLGGPARVRPRTPPLPVGRTPLPSPERWRGARPDHAVVHDLKRLGCRIDRVDEWLRLRCPNASVTVRPPTGREPPLVLNRPDGATAIVAALEGTLYKLQITSATHRGELILEWPLGEPSQYVHAYEQQKTSSPTAPTAAELALCACQREVDKTSTCSDLYGGADADCARTYAGSCALALLCARGDRATPPACADGRAAEGVVPRCPAPPAVAATAAPRGR